MNLLSLTLLTTGGILMYSGIKGKNPVDVVKGALRGTSVTPSAYVETPDAAPPTTTAPTGTTRQNNNTVVGV